MHDQLVKAIAFYLRDGVEILDFAGPLEVFSFARYQIFTVSRTEKATKSQGVLTIMPNYATHNAPDAETRPFNIPR